MQKRVITLLVGALWMFSAFAQTTSSPDNFFKRFQFVKENQQLVEIRDNALNGIFSVTPYLHFLKAILKDEQKRMLSKASYDKEILQILRENNEDESLSDEITEREQIVLDSMHALAKIDIDQIFSHPEFIKVKQEFETKISDALGKLGITTIAKLNETNFYYKRHVTYEIVKTLLNIAKSTLSSIPVLNTISYVMVQVEKLIRERRNYHQNMALHYFENFTPDTLGMEANENLHSLSSIYESKIPWYAFWESSFARNNWDQYGQIYFQKNYDLASDKLAKYSGKYESVGERVNFAFNHVKLKGENVIINLVDSADMIRKSPSVAYYYSQPQKVIRTRVVLQLAQLGMSFLSLPQFVKDITGNYLKSMYAPHKITEGALHAYFESNGMKEDQKRILAQTLNPFEPDFYAPFSMIYLK